MARLSLIFISAESN
jgi:hypothetical protein